MTILEMLDVLNARVLALHEHQLRIGSALAEARKQMAQARDLFPELAPPEVRPKRHAKKKTKKRTVRRAPPPAVPSEESDSRAGKRQVLGKSLAQLRAGSKRPAVTSRLLRASAATE